LSGATIWSNGLRNLVSFYRDVLCLKVAYEPPDLEGNIVQLLQPLL
jgi:hypothetical protein